MTPFKRNRYTERYMAIVASARRRRFDPDYTEKHHVIPKFCGGPNVSSNMVRLTPRNHFICHQLLVKMVRLPIHVKGASYSLWMMSNHHRYEGRITASAYSRLRKDVSKAVSADRPTDFLIDVHWRQIARSNRRRLKGKRPYNYGKSPSQSTRDKISAATSKGMNTPEVRAKISGPKSRQHRRALSEAAYNRQRLRCDNCGDLFIPQMLSRWHGSNCRAQ